MMLQLRVDHGSNKLEVQHPHFPPYPLYFLKPPKYIVQFVEKRDKFEPFLGYRGEVGKWVAIIAVTLRLFFHERFPDWLELSGALILGTGLFTDTIRGDWIGVAICLLIGCYLLQEHIRASGGFRNSFTKSNGISNAVGLILLLVYPVWALIILLI